jgi:hypothetical protein
MSLLSSLKDLRQQVETKLDRILLREEEINDLLVKYRLFITQVSFKATHLDRSVWTNFDQAVSRAKDIREEYTALVIRTPGQLRKIIAKADDLLKAQGDLIELINHSMEGTRFYDEMERAKLDKRRQEAIEEERSRMLLTAKRSLIQALHYVLLLERSSERIVQDPGLLDIRPILDQWEEELRALLRLNSDPSVDAETLVRRMESLTAMIIGVPDTARRVRRTGEEFAKFLSINREFATEGIDVTSDDEVAQFRTYFRRSIPEFWRAGDIDSIRGLLDQIQAYLQRFSEYVITEEDLEPPADSERPSPGRVESSHGRATRDVPPSTSDRTDGKQSSSLFSDQAPAPPETGFPLQDEDER